MASTKAVVTIGAPDFRDKRTPKGLLAVAQIRFHGGLLGGLWLADVKVWQGLPGEGIAVRCGGLPGFDEGHPLAMAIIRAYEDCESRLELDLEEIGDDREPPDHDGEAFRGGEAAAYAREQQADARCLK